MTLQVSKADDLINAIRGQERQPVAQKVPQLEVEGLTAKNLAAKIQQQSVEKEEEMPDNVFETAEEKLQETGTSVPFAPEELAPAAKLSPSNSIAEFIKNEEGLKLQVYDDATGRTLSKEQLMRGDYEGFPTVGWGHKLTEEEIKNGLDAITQEQAEEMFNADLERAKIALQEEYKDAPPVNQQEYDAHLSLIYNTGSFKNFPKLREAIKAGDRKGMVEEMLDIVSSGGRRLRGLELRREKEAAIFKEARYVPESSPDVVLGLQTGLPAGEYVADGKVVTVAANGTVESIASDEA